MFFDAGETLVHPHPTFPDLLAKVLLSEGHEVAVETIRDRGHVVFDRFQQAADRNELWTTSPERSRRFWYDVYGIFLRELQIPDAKGLVEIVHAAFTDRANYALFDDVIPALERLRDAGIRLGVVSNFEAWLELLLDELGVSGFFDVRIVSGVEGLEKPDPRIFELALERAGVTASESVYVGDNPAFDVEPALAVGMFPVLIDRRERFPDAPGARITSMDQLPAAMGM